MIRREKIIELYRSGLTGKQVAADVGVSQHYVGKVLLLYAGLRRKAMRSSIRARHEKVIRLHKEGMLIKEIAKQTNYAVSTVRGIIMRGNKGLYK